MMIIIIEEYMKGQQEVYDSHEELLSQGIDLAYLIGLIQDKDEGDEEERKIYSYKNVNGKS